jgi:hypothetical protein
MISNLSPELLKGAIEFFAQQIGAQIFYNQMTDTRFGHGGERVIVGFTTTDCPYGIGFNIDPTDGSLQVCGDSYSQHAGYDKYAKFAMKGMITNAYLVAMKAAQEQAPVQMQVEEHRIVLEACF